MGGVDQYAPAVLQAGVDNGITPRGIVIAFATVYVESDWIMYANPNDPQSMSFPHDALSFDANSVGLFQQRAEWWGTVAQRMDAYQSAVMFFNALKGHDYNNAANSPGFYAQAVQGSAFPDRYDQHVVEAQALYDRLTASAVQVSKVVVKPVEKVLDYPRGPVGDYDGVVQQYSWDCGPASAQIILAAKGIDKTEDYLIQQIGTTVNGTNSADCIVPVLNALLPGSGYSSVWLQNDPPSQDQIEALWTNVKGSIDSGYGTILNFESPPNNRPIGTRGSVSPAYGGSDTIFHYTAGMGYAQDADGSRHIWVADCGFSPFGYWCALEQVAELIVPHAYAFAAASAVVLTSAVTPAAPVAPVAAPVAPPAAPVAPAAVPVTPVVPASTLPPLVAPTDELADLWLEWNAVMYGDQSSVAQIVAAAKGGDARSLAALALIEKNNPTALETFITTKGK